jgi:hypothetical protein
MGQVFRCVLITVATTLLAHSPVKHTYAYSRSTTPGIPGGGSVGGSPKNPFPTSYFIYVVVEKGTPLSVSGVWLQGRYYGATLRKVNPPVLIERDVAVPTGQKDTLVRQTSDDVYQVELAAAKASSAGDDTARKLKQRNEVVVVLKARQSTWYGEVKTIVALHPAAAM